MRIDRLRLAELLGGGLVFEVVEECQPAQEGLLCRRRSGVGERHLPRFARRGRCHGAGEREGGGEEQRQDRRQTSGEREGTHDHLRVDVRAAYGVAPLQAPRSPLSKLSVKSALGRLAAWTHAEGADSQVPPASRPVT